jgi:folate-dependent phosphoribosylglycinamide formyltransferase PurN
MDKSWLDLQALCQNREEMLKNEIEELRFNNDAALVEQIVANYEVQLQSVQHRDDPTEAEEDLAQHRELIRELDATKVSFF